MTADGHPKIKVVGYQYGQATRPFPSNAEWDVFISHASEDKDDFVRPLAEGLEQRGLRVWFDESTLKVGDSLRSSIDQGLTHSKFGIVVISKHFLNKEWPQRELDGLASRELDGVRVILPIWHNIDAEAVREASPMLADRVAISSSENLERVIEDLLQVIGAPAAEARSTTPVGRPRKKRTASRPSVVIQAWWKRGVIGIGLVAALTTALVNLQVIRNWFAPDPGPVEAIGSDRPDSVQLPPGPNMAPDTNAAPERLQNSSQTKARARRSLISKRNLRPPLSLGQLLRSTRRSTSLDNPPLIQTAPPET